MGKTNTAKKRIIKDIGNEQRREDNEEDAEKRLKNKPAKTLSKL